MSNTKLTLSIQDAVISKAKAYARRQNLSLSKIVELYLANIPEQETPVLEVSAWTRDLAAVKKPTPDFDYKTGHEKYISAKYSEK